MKKIFPSIKRMWLLVLSTLLLFSLCSCGKAEDFLIYENIPDDSGLVGGYISDWYTPVKPLKNTPSYLDKSAPPTFSLSWNGQTIQGTYLETYEKAIDRCRSFDVYEVEGKWIEFHVQRDSGKLLWYDNKESYEGTAISASERIELLNHMKEECEKQVSPQWKEHYRYEVDPEGYSMYYYPSVEGWTPSVQKQMGVRVTLNADGTAKHVDAFQFLSIEQYSKKELEQSVAALSSDRVTPALENHLEKMYSLNETTVFLTMGKEDPNKDYRDYEKGEYTKYELTQEQWLFSSEGKLARLVFLNVYTKLSPQNAPPEEDCQSKSLLIFLA